jgi:hypothetical protein
VIVLVDIAITLPVWAILTLGACDVYTLMTCDGALPASQLSSAPRESLTNPNQGDTSW